MGLIDKLFGRSRSVTLGKQRYRNSTGEKIVVTKVVCYAVRSGNSTIHMYDQQDVDEYCKQRQFKPVP